MSTHNLGKGSILDANDVNGRLNENFRTLIKDDPWAPVLEQLGQPRPSASLANAVTQALNGYPLEQETINQAFSGVNQTLGFRVQQEIINFNSWHFVAFIKKQVTQLGKRSMSRLIFSNTLFNPNAPLGMARHINYERQSTEFTVRGYILGFRFEKIWLENAPDAPLIFQCMLRAIASSACATARVSCLNELKQCKNIFTIKNAMRGVYSTMMDFTRDWNDMFVIGNKSERGLIDADTYVRKVRGGAGTVPPTMVVLCEGAKNLAAWTSPTQHDYWREGPAGEIVKRLGGAAFNVLNNNTICIEEPPLNLSLLGDTQYRAFEDVIETGRFYVCDNSHTKTWSINEPYNTSAARSVLLQDFTDQCNDVVQDILEAIRADQHFNPSNGELRRQELNVLAANYEKLANEYDFHYHQSANGDPLVDPHIAFDINGHAFVVSFLGDIDPHYFSSDGLKCFARINAATERSLLPASVFTAFDAGVRVLREAGRNVFVSNKETANPLEAMAVATGSYYLNRRNDENGSGYATGLTPGNEVGSDYLPPVIVIDGKAYIATQRSATGDVEPVFFRFVRGQSGAQDQSTSGFYTTEGGPPTAGTLQRVPVPAPDFPPGFSTASAAYYLASEYNAGTPEVVSWTQGRSNSQGKFQAVADFVAAWDQIYERLFAIYGGDENKPDTLNLLMRPEAVPFFQRPAGGINATNFTQLSKIALLQQAVLGYQVPIGIANLVPRAGTAAISLGLRNARSVIPEAEFRAGEVPVAGETQYDKQQQANEAAGVLTPALALNGALLTLVNEPSLAPDLLADLTANQGRDFLQRLEQTAVRTSTSPFRSPQSEDNYNAFEDLVSRPNTAFSNRSVAQMLTSNDSAQIAQATQFLNRVWNSTANQQTRFTERTLNDLAARSVPSVGQKRSAYEVAGDFTRDNAGTSVRGEQPTQYRMTRLSTYRDTWKSARARQSILRPGNPFDQANTVVSPYQDGRSSTLDADVPLDEIGDRDDTARNMYRKGRSEFAGGLGPVGWYAAPDFVTGAGSDSRPIAQENKRQRGAADPRAKGAAALPSGYRTYEQGNRTQYDEEDYDVTRMITDDSRAGNFADVVLSPSLLWLTQTSRWMTARFHDIEKMSGTLERCIAAVMICSALTQQLLVNCVENNHVLPRSYVYFNAFIELTVGSGVWLNEGVGIVEHAFEDATTTFDGNTLGLQARFSFNMGVYVTDPERVTNFPAFCIKGMKAGGGSALIGSGKFLKNGGVDDGQYDFSYVNPMAPERRGDRAVWCTGVDYQKLPNPLPLSGRYTPEVYTGQMNPADEHDLHAMAWPSAAFANMQAAYHLIGAIDAGEVDMDKSGGWDRMFGGFDTMIRSTHLLWEGRRSEYNPKDGKYVLKAAGSGPLGIVAPGSGALQGRAELLNPGLTATVQYGSQVVVNA